MACSGVGWAYLLTNDPREGVLGGSSVVVSTTHHQSVPGTLKVHATSTQERGNVFSQFSIFGECNQNKKLFKSVQPK